jgi:hypothetical protein
MYRSACGFSALVAGLAVATTGCDIAKQWPKLEIELEILPAVFQYCKDLPYIWETCDGVYADSTLGVPKYTSLHFGFSSISRKGVPPQVRTHFGAIVNKRCFRARLEISSRAPPEFTERTIATPSIGNVSRWVWRRTQSVHPLYTSCLLVTSKSAVAEHPNFVVQTELTRHHV